MSNTQSSTDQNEVARHATLMAAIKPFAEAFDLIKDEEHLIGAVICKEHLRAARTAYLLAEVRPQALSAGELGDYNMILRLIDAVEGELDGLAIDAGQALAILSHTLHGGKTEFAKVGASDAVLMSHDTPSPQSHLRGDDLDIQTAYEAWIDRTVGARAPITAFYAGYRAALTTAEGK